ncbi:MAG: ATP phosphoribosyltransferase regulatory subunit [Pseudomonadota bacterium]
MLETLLTHLRDTAPDVADVPVLQPADPFLETAGEDLRRRVFITEAVDGTPMCLRPEFTIPVGLHHIRSGDAAARYACGGLVFRQARPDGTEFEQVGIEDLGNAVTVAADAQCLADFLSSLQVAGIDHAQTTLGDQALFDAVVKALDLPAALARRLRRAFGENGQLARLMEDRASVDDDARDRDNPARKMALAGDEAGLINLVANELSAAGVAPKAGRSPEAIARRMIERTQEEDLRLEPEAARILTGFLDLNCPLAEAPEHLTVFAGWAGLDLHAAIKRFDERLGGLDRRKTALHQVTYSAAFGRKLDYYTGLVFEATIGGVSLGGGGRYDRLCTLLGSPTPIPAVGFSLSLDRVQAAVSGEGRGA